MSSRLSNTMPPVGRDDEAQHETNRQMFDRTAMPNLMLTRASGDFGTMSSMATIAPSSSLTLGLTAAASSSESAEPISSHRTSNEGSLSIGASTPSTDLEAALLKTLAGSRSASNELPLSVANLPSLADVVSTPRDLERAGRKLQAPPPPRRASYQRSHHPQQRSGDNDYVPWNASTLTFGAGGALSEKAKPPTTERSLFTSGAATGTASKSVSFMSSFGFGLDNKGSSSASSRDLETPPSTKSSPDEVVSLDKYLLRKKYDEVAACLTPGNGPLSSIMPLSPISPYAGSDAVSHNPRYERHSVNNPQIRNLRYVALALSVVTTPSCPILFLCWIPAVVMALMRRRSPHMYIVSIALSAIIIVSVVALFIFAYFLFITMLSIDSPSEASANRYYVVVNAPRGPDGTGIDPSEPTMAPSSFNEDLADPGVENDHDRMLKLVPEI